EIRLMSRELRCELVLPRAERVAPSLDREVMRPHIEKRARSAPVILRPGLDAFHWRFVPFLRAGQAPFQHRENDVVPILEDIRVNREIFPNRTFHRVAPAVDQRTNILDDDSWRMKTHGPMMLFPWSPRQVSP